MQPPSLVDILWSNSDEPVVALAHVRAKFHYQISKLVQVWSHLKVDNSFVFKCGNLFLRKAMHLYYSQLVRLDFKWESKFLELLKPSLQGD